MATEKQRRAARQNIKKAQAAWRRMSSRAHAMVQPEGRGRAKPGATGKGQYYHIEVRSRSQFKTFRTQDVGRKGGIQSVAGKRASGSWDDQKWLISKKDAHVSAGRLVPDTAAARKVISTLGSTPRRISGDRFRAKPRPNVPERSKPTARQRRARSTNIRKAQKARRRMR